MVHQEVASLVRGEIGQSGTSPQGPLRLQHQALLEGIRHLLPLLKQEATDSIGGPDPERLQIIVARRTTFTGVPDRLFDHSFEDCYDLLRDGTIHVKVRREKDGLRAEPVHHLGRHGASDPEFSVIDEC